MSRHVFVPRFYDEQRNLVDSADPDQRDQWLSAVYSDVPLVTQLMRVPDTEVDFFTSSSSMPSLMIDMLEALSVADGHRVLEIGTGTGYNAALLSHRLGAANVTSIDLDPGLVADARQRLASIGYRPHDTVTGRVLARPGSFMWLRARVDNPLRDGGRYTTVFDLDGAQSRLTDVDPRLLDDPDFRFVVQRYVPTLQSINWSRCDEAVVLVLRCSDASWAEITETETGRYALTQGGPHPIWDEVERAAAVWNALGRPARHRFGLTATVTGGQRYWLDTPDGRHLDR